MAMAGPAPVFGDAALLEQLAGNVVDRALQPQRGMGPRHHRRVGDEALLRVANSGQVVAPEEVESLFEPRRSATVAWR